MSRPHRCPICNGTGKIHMTPYGTSADMQYHSCHSCNGTGIVWEPESHIPKLPHFPPTIYPDSPSIPGLTFPENFEFPKEIVENSRNALIKKFEEWIEILKDQKDNQSDE